CRAGGCAGDDHAPHLIPLYEMGRLTPENPTSKLQEEQPMSEPRKINIGGGHRAPSNAQNVYHAGDAQAASGRSVNTGASAAHSDDAAREAARRRYEQQRAASQRGYEDARLEEARARARA